MDYSIETLPPEKLQCDCQVVGVYRGQGPSPAAAALDTAFQGQISAAVARGDIAGNLGDALLLTGGTGGCVRVLLVGLGGHGPLTAKDYRKALATAAAQLKKPYIQSVASSLAQCPVNGHGTAWKVRQTIEAFADAAYQYTHTKTNKDTESKLRTLVVTVADGELEAARLGLVQGQAIADGVALAKWLGDLPGNLCTPRFLAEQATALGGRHPRLSVEVLDEEAMARLGMGALLSVARGSRQPPRFIILNFQNGGPEAKPIVLIGKGLTFDAGGISLKPGPGMDEMKYDMCGGATVLGVLQAAMRMELPLNIVGLVPATENLPDGDANKPGDVCTSLAGKTIEVLNTDAEGRLLLCDALSYAGRFNPEVVIDIATLTGACLVALGRVASGLLGNDDALCDELAAAGLASGDSVWRLPLWDEYQELLKSNFADLANIGGKDAGTITAACFLANFAQGLRWAHLDIAGTAWRPGPAANKGATGRPVPLLCQYLIDRGQAVAAADAGG